MGYWMKLYTDILDDEKVMCDLSDTGQLGMFFIFLVAKKLDNPVVGTIQSICFQTRKPTEFWNKALPELVSTGILLEKNGTYTVKNFEKRQIPIDPTERSRQSRKNKNNATQMQRNCNVSDDLRHGEKRREEKEREVEVENTTPSAFSDLSVAFVNTSGLPELSGGVKKYTESINKMVKLGVTPNDLETAIKELREKNYDITGPGSCVNPAIIVMGKRKGAKGVYKGKEFNPLEVIGDRAH